MKTLKRVLLTLQNDKLPLVVFQPVQTTSQLVDIYKRQDAYKLTTKSYPSSETKWCLETYWSSEADNKPSITCNEA